MRLRPLPHRAAPPCGRTVLSIAALASALAAGPAFAQPLAPDAFVPQEVEVCPASSRVYDPEFEPTTQRMVYFDGRSAVRVVDVLPDGSLAGTGCKGQVVARNATIGLPDLPFRNGPEWATSARGLEITVTRLDDTGRPYMALASSTRRGWKLTTLPDSGERGLPLVSSDATDAAPRLVYAHVTGPGTYELAWRDAFDPASEGALPGDVDPRTGGAPRWIPGQRALTLGVDDPATGLRQAARYDVDSGTLSFLTRDAGAKDEVWLWHAPEFGGELGLMTVADGCCLRFYRDVGGTWTLQRELRADSFSTQPMIVSPELLVLDGRSYVVMQLGTSRLSPSDTWIAAVDAGGLAPVQVSDPSRPDIARSEPEWHVTGEGVFVYVTASASRNRFALNRLRTPLAVPAAR